MVSVLHGIVAVLAAIVVGVLAGVGILICMLGALSVFFWEQFWGGGDEL